MTSPFMVQAAKIIQSNYYPSALMSLNATKRQPSMGGQVCFGALLFHPSFYTRIQSENLDLPIQNLLEASPSQ